MRTFLALSLLASPVFAASAHFDVQASYAPPPRAADKGEILVSFVPKVADVFVDEEPAPRLKLDAAQTVLVDRQAPPPDRVTAIPGNHDAYVRATQHRFAEVFCDYLRGDSALYEHELMGWLDDQAIGYAISGDMSPQLSQCIGALPEDHWKLDREETDATRQWAEVNYLPSAAPQRDPLQPALSLQACRPTRGISHRQAQTAALFAAQHRRQGCPPRPRDPPALHQRDRTSPRRRVANHILPQTPT